MIHVDDSFTMNRKFPDYCHLWSSDNSVTELQAFADKLGLKREWFQDRAGFPHYDISAQKRVLALKLGAVYKPLREWLRERRRADGH